MKTTGERLADWAVRKIQSEYPDDVCLLLKHDTLQLECDLDASGFSFYVPATNRAGGLARTFIIDGIGYDLFPMPWDRIERMAQMKEYNTTCLANSTILYARSDEDRRRFEALRAKLTANLQNPVYMRERAGEWLAVAVDLYRDMLFEPRLYKVRKDAGYIADVLSIAVAFANGRYFRHGQTNQLRELAGMGAVPQGFAPMYEGVVRAKDSGEQLRLCRDMIDATRAFLRPQGEAKGEAEPDFAELASWYQELCYTWRRVYHWCDAGDPVNAYLWCCLLQDEADRLGVEFGVSPTDILGVFDHNDLTALRRRAQEVERRFIDAIQAHGVAIERYTDLEDFFAKNA